MGLFDAIASSAANLTDNIVGMANQNHQNKVNLRLMREQNAFNAQQAQDYRDWETDRKSTRLNSSHITRSRMPSSA